MNERGKRATFEQFDQNAQLAVVSAGADRIASPHTIDITGTAQRDVLAWDELIVVRQIFGNIKGQRNRVFGFLANVPDIQSMETRRAASCRVSLRFLLC